MTPRASGTRGFIAPCVFLVGNDFGDDCWDRSKLSECSALLELVIFVNIVASPVIAPESTVQALMSGVQYMDVM